jgi:hypothetical protein
VTHFRTDLKCRVQLFVQLLNGQETLCGSHTEFESLKDHFPLKLRFLRFLIVRPRNLIFRNDAIRDIHQIINAHEKLAKTFRIQLDENDKCIPILHAVPKMHKTPYKFRFIAGARNSSMKNVSKLVQRALIFLRGHFRNYCRIAKSRGNKGLYWAIDGSIQTVNDMKSIKVKKNTTIFTADFASLFTNLPHDLVLSKVMTLVGKCFANSGGKQGLVFTYENIYYADANPNKNGSVFYHKVEIVEMIDQVLKQGYVKFGNIVFHQKCGVPMGGNASPMLADLTLSVIEFEYLNKQQNFTVARTFGKVYRYMDDIAVIGEGNFKQVFHQIYPNSLQLEETSTSEKESNFLDLTICIEPNNTIVTRLYNKTDDYAFKVVRYPHCDSNMHIDVAIRCFHAEILRFTRICSKLQDFSQRLRCLYINFKDNGFSHEQLSLEFFSFISHRPGVLTKYGLLDNHSICTFWSHCLI